MPIMQEGRGKRMPFLFLSPSTQYFNPYVTTGDERYWMNALADEMMPYLHASGITVTRNDPDGSAAQSIRDSNASRQDFHLALHSNAAPQALAGQLRGVDFYYYPTSEAGLRMANILVDNMKTIYPLPDRVQARPSTIIGEIRRTRVPAVLAEIGYHDNVDDANWLTGNLDAVARTLSLGVTEYFGVPFLTPGDEFEAEAAGADGYLRLRSYPEPDAEILAQLPNGTPVTVLGNFDTWYTVRADTLYGFAPITEVQLAVMPLADLVKIARKNIKKEQQNALPNGLICLKGGELQHEILPFRKQAVSLNLSDHFKEEFFQTKKVVYVPV